MGQEKSAPLEKIEYLNEIKNRTPEEVEEDIMVWAVNRLWKDLRYAYLSDSEKEMAEKEITNHLGTTFNTGRAKRGCGKDEYLIFMEESLLSHEAILHRVRGVQGSNDLERIIDGWIRSKKTQIIDDHKTEIYLKKTRLPSHGPEDERTEDAAGTDLPRHSPERVRIEDAPPRHNPEGERFEGSAETDLPRHSPEGERTGDSTGTDLPRHNPEGERFEGSAETDLPRHSPEGERFEDSAETDLPRHSPEGERTGDSTGTDLPRHNPEGERFEGSAETDLPRHSPEGERFEDSTGTDLPQHSPEGERTGDSTGTDLPRHSPEGERFEGSAGTDLPQHSPEGERTEDAAGTDLPRHSPEGERTGDSTGTDLPRHSPEGERTEVNVLQKKNLTAAQYLIIEYLKNEKKLDKGRLTQTSYIANLARKYPASEGAFREQLKGMNDKKHKILPYLTIQDLRAGQTQSAKENYEAVLEYFQNENNVKLTKEVELILNRFY